VIRFWIGLAAAPAEQAAPAATARGAAVQPGIVVRVPVQEVAAAGELAPRRSAGSPRHAAFHHPARRFAAGDLAPGRVTAAPPVTIGRLAGRRPLTTAVRPVTAVGIKVTWPAGLLAGCGGAVATPGAGCWLGIIRLGIIRLGIIWPAVIGPAPGLPARIVSPAAYLFPPALFPPAPRAAPVSWIVPPVARLASSTRIACATRIPCGIARGGRRIAAPALAWVRSPTPARVCLGRRGGLGVAGHLAWGCGASVAAGAVGR
jgi:hypothetical protein